MSREIWISIKFFEIFTPFFCAGSPIGAKKPRNLQRLSSFFGFFVLYYSYYAGSNARCSEKNGKELFVIRTEKTAVMNFENALRGMRNPLSSWDRIDSFTDAEGCFVLGENDRALARRLCQAGSDHRKFIRQIFVSVDITAPLYWWKEYDTYKVGTVANSTSTMHKIHAKPFSLEDFSHDQMDGETLRQLQLTVDFLEALRQRYLAGKERRYWYDMIQLLPSSYNQMRTCTLNYENLRGIYNARREHKLDEWRAFCRWIESLPYAADLILPGGEGE